jgi:hypothetical protein
MVMQPTAAPTGAEKPSLTDTLTYTESEVSEYDPAEETKIPDTRTISSIDSIVDNSLLRQSMTMYESKIEQQKLSRQNANQNLENLKTQLTQTTSKVAELE